MLILEETNQFRLSIEGKTGIVKLVRHNPAQIVILEGKQAFECIKLYKKIQYVKDTNINTLFEYLIKKYTKTLANS